MAIQLPAAPLDGEVWEFVVKAIDTGINTAIVNRLRLRVTALDVANPPLIEGVYFALNAFRTRWRTGIRTQLCDKYLVQTYSLQRIAGVYVLPGQNHAAISYDQRRDYTGEDPADRGALALAQNPNFVVARINWNTALINRNTRAMMRVSPIPDANVDGALLTAPYMAALQAASDLLWPVLTDAPNKVKWTPCVFSAQSLVGVEPAVPAQSMAIYTNDLTGAAIDSFVGSQLTRKNRGSN